MHRVSSCTVLRPFGPDQNAATATAYVQARPSVLPEAPMPKLHLTPLAAPQGAIRGLPSAAVAGRHRKVMPHHAPVLHPLQG